MTFAMGRAEREAFLAGVHVAVLSVDDPGHGPLSVPVWYAYEPGGTVDVITGKQSAKARRLRQSGRCSLCAQTEAPYRYVSIEGRVADIVDPAPSRALRAIAYRYLGQDSGDLYLAATRGDAENNVMFRIAPERWRTADYAGQFG